MAETFEVDKVAIPPGMEGKPRFDPEGAMRMTNKEMAAFTGGIVALVLQIGDPAVAYYLNQTGKLPAILLRDSSEMQETELT